MSNTFRYSFAYLATTVLWKKPIHIRGRDVKLPGFAMSSAQLAVAAGDLDHAGLVYLDLEPEHVTQERGRGREIGHLQVGPAAQELGHGHMLWPRNSAGRPGRGMTG